MKRGEFDCFCLHLKKKEKKKASSQKLNLQIETRSAINRILSRSLSFAPVITLHVPVWFIPIGLSSL